MQRILCLIIAISLSSGLLGLEACRPSEPQNALVSDAIQRMEGYLVAGYDPDLGLIRESPYSNPNVYWLYSDNYLASLALKKTAPEMSTSIARAMEGYTFRPSERWHVLSGEVVWDALFAWGSKDICKTERVKTETPSPTLHMEDWQEYADRLLLAAINAFNRGDIHEASGLFVTAQEMFDGLGFRDKAFVERGYYDTYKLALYVIAGSSLGMSAPERQSVIELMLSLQENAPASPRYGGVYTEYDDNLKPLPHTDTNTETTSLTILALRAK